MIDLGYYQRYQFLGIETGTFPAQRGPEGGVITEKGVDFFLIFVPKDRKRLSI